MSLAVNPEDVQPLKWTRIGEVWTETGRILLVDPDFAVDAGVTDESLIQTDFKAVDKPFYSPQDGSIVVTTYADASYPVWLVRDQEGLPIELRIDLRGEGGLFFDDRAGGVA